MRSGGPDAPRLPRLPLDERTWREAHAAFKGIKIELTHFPGSRRKKTCRGLTKLPANRQMFCDDTGRVINNTTWVSLFASRFFCLGASSFIALL